MTDNVIPPSAGAGDGGGKIAEATAREIVEQASEAYMSCEDDNKAWAVLEDTLISLITRALSTPPLSAPALPEGAKDLADQLRFWGGNGETESQAFMLRVADYLAAAPSPSPAQQPSEEDREHLARKLLDNPNATVSVGWHCPNCRNWHGPHIATCPYPPRDLRTLGQKIRSASK